MLFSFIVRQAEKNPDSKALHYLAAVLSILPFCLAPFWFAYSIGMLLLLMDVIFIGNMRANVGDNQIVLFTLAWMALTDASPIFWFLLQNHTD